MNAKIFFNRTFNKNYLKNMIQWTFRYYGSRRTIELLERLKNLSFHLRIKIGISLSMKNLWIPKEKYFTINISKKKKKKRYVHRQNTIITPWEVNQTLINVWRSINENFKGIISEIFDKEDFLNSLYLIAFSGARGNLIQTQQLIGIRSLMINPIGRTIQSPIRSSFKEGLTLTEFVCLVTKFF
jgi:DNA-directed RNA polymerase subunit beta'